jgi:hypothetical protein
MPSLSPLLEQFTTKLLRKSLRRPGLRAPSIIDDSSPEDMGIPAGRCQNGTIPEKPTNRTPGKGMDEDETVCTATSYARFVGGSAAAQGYPTKPVRVVAAAPAANAGRWHQR